MLHYHVGTYTLSVIPNNKQTLILLLLILITAINGIIYIIIVPPWQSPDEPTHFEYVQLMADSNTISGLVVPNFSLQEQIISSMDHYYFWKYLGWTSPKPLPVKFDDTLFLRVFRAQTQIGIKPPLYYFLASLLLRICPEHSIIFNLYLLRSFSLLLTIATVILIFFTARLIFPEDLYFPLATAAFAAFLPEFILIGTSVSLDPMANLMSALFIYLMIRLQYRGLKFHLLAVIVLVLISSAFVTYKCLTLIPIFILGICVYLFFSPEVQKNRVRIVLTISGLLFAGVIVYSFLVWSNPRIAQIFIFKASDLHSKFLRLLSGDLHFATYYYPWFHNEVFKSFWIKFGWAMYSVNPVYYLIIKVISIISLIGLVVFLIKMAIIKSYVSSSVRRAILTLIISSAIVLIVYYWYWGLGARQVTAQGRHLFVGLPAWAILFVLGLRELSPKKFRVPLYFLLLGCFILFNIVSIFGYIIPVFHS